MLHVQFVLHDIHTLNTFHINIQIKEASLLLQVHQSLAIRRTWEKTPQTWVTRKTMVTVYHQAVSFTMKQHSNVCCLKITFSCVNNTGFHFEFHITVSYCTLLSLYLFFVGVLFMDVFIDIKKRSKTTIPCSWQHSCLNRLYFVLYK